MSKFALGQKLYYVGNDPMELAFVKYGDEVILVTMPENEQALNLIVRTLSGNKIWVSKSNLSESKPDLSVSGDILCECKSSDKAKKIVTALEYAQSTIKVNDE